MNVVTSRFLEALDKTGQDSMHAHVVNLTKGVLVFDSSEQSTELLESCFRLGFPVSVSLVSHDDRVPRLEVSEDETLVVGEANIREYLTRRRCDTR